MVFGFGHGQSLKGRKLQINAERTDPPYFPPSMRTDSPPLTSWWEVGPLRNGIDHQGYRREGGHNYQAGEGQRRMRGEGR